ncbi:MAG: LysM peptidoglycan-binding domain-containing protein, partial [Gammaproteobacteria bacterium]|nr:LysM peptidoglycan-binding domain-containing protein [Gammaproteobacteria bacterium]
LQMTWPGGQLIKQYTLLLDPPRRIQPARAARTSRATPASKPAASRISADNGSYGPVRSGETLWPIAKRLKPRGITTRQMAMALLRANPQAFIDGNVNKLRAGATLTIPQRAFIEQLDAATARAQFNAQTRAWQAPIATSPRPVEAPVTRTPVLQPTPETAAKQEKKAPASKPEDEAPVSEDQLRIVTADKKMPDAPAGSQQELQKQLLVTMEEIESNRITTEGIESRLARMEAELTRMQKLVELKDAQIAALQSDAAAREDIQAAAQTAEPAPPPAVSSGVKTAPETPADKAAAPISIEQTEPLPTDTAPKAVRPWYEEYLWAIWLVLGLLGLVALLMLLRRPRAVSEDAAIAALPSVGAGGAAAAALAPGQEPPGASLREAEEDFRRLAEQELTESAAEIEEKLPGLEVSATARRADDETDDGVTDSLLNELMDNADRPQADSTVRESDFSEDDIASWVAELGTEAEHVDGQSANDEQVSLDDDIPSILTELDDQLSGEKPSDTPTPAPIQLEPVSHADEDDTFSMSLDLARAYLEIGDQDGARDMLKQALAGARDPDHRRQIEELLTQID